MIVEASVTGLLGEFDHTIEIRPDWKFAIACGLNGVGKTKLLEIINATVNNSPTSTRFGSDWPT